jgi:hypothetical protein
MIELFTKVRLTVDFPEHGLKKGDSATVIEYYPMNGNGEDGYSLEGFHIPLAGVTLEVFESQIESIEKITPEDLSKPTAFKTL